MTDPSLSPRQREVAQLIADGFTTKQVAGRLGIHQHTVVWHVHAIIRRIGGDRQKDALVVVAKWWWMNAA